jgi:hypothetical protein
VADSLILGPDEMVDGRPFTDPELSQYDLETMRYMAQQLLDAYDDPVVCNVLPNQQPVCQSDPQGRHFRIYYVQPHLHFGLKNLSVVGFFGHTRPGADVQPLIKADKKFEKVFHEHPGLLSLSTVRLANGDFANLVVFTNGAARDKWGQSKLHIELVTKISPPYYKSIRLNNGRMPFGLDQPDAVNLVRVKYIDYSSSPPWRATRVFG